MARVIFGSGGAAFLVAGVGVAFAHHSPATYDLDTQVTIEGTIAAVDWRNPHSYLQVETQGFDGQGRIQEIELAATVMMERAGLRQEFLPVGAHVSLLASPNREGSGQMMLGLTVTLADHGVYALGPRGRPFVADPAGGDPDVAATADGLAGQWAPSRVAGEFQSAVATWPLTEAALEAQRTFRFPAFSGCMPKVAPPMLSTNPQMRTIEVGDDVVVMRFDAPGEDTVRTVYLDQGEHPDGLEMSLLGHSIGRWDGETLVIDTIGFAADPMGLSFGVPSGTGKHLVERLSPADDRRHLEYEFTVEDPEYLSGPASFTTRWDYRPELLPAGDACDAPPAGRRGGGAPEP